MLDSRQHILVDSSLTTTEAIKQNPEHPCPAKILKDQVLFDVDYYSFDGRLHSGQLVAHKDLVEDIKGAFTMLLEDHFPIQSVIPIADTRYLWDDNLSGIANNTSAFNYRFVRDTKEFSNHATGRAIDFNPLINPYFPDTRVFPVEASYQPGVPGTIVPGSKLVEYFKNLGWEWGGDWLEDVDYQHFQKPIS